MGATFAIVGASLAGGTAAATLRAAGFDGRVLLIGAEPHPPYERPPLSKDYLRGEQSFAQTLVRPPAFYRDNAIETLFGVRVTQVDPGERMVELASGQRVRYDKLLIATGSRNRRVPLPGRDLAGVYDLHTVADCDRLRAEVQPGRTAVVLGMGFIGCEVAASLHQMGLAVTVVTGAQAPLVRVVGEQIGRVIAGLHRDHGVEMICDDPAAACEGAGRVERVITRSGRRIACDVAVVAQGSEPVTDLVAGTGMAVADGIVTDASGRTSAEGIYAAGDVAHHAYPAIGRHLRVAHWQNALKQGTAAARSMLGTAQPYDEVPWFWSDQYEVNLQYAGFPTAWKDVAVRGSLEERTFIAFSIEDGRIAAAVALNRGRELRQSLPLIAHRVPVDVATVQDADRDLRTVALVTDERPDGPWQGR